jgi:hypothetical protein
VADLNDRGQLVLVAGFALAVMFVALALVVNSAIFTENLATRGETTGGSDALLGRHQAEENVGNVIGSLNNRTTATPVAALNRSMLNLTLQSGIQHAQDGRLVTADVVEGSEQLSARLFQENDSRTYSNATGTTDWTLASEATRIHGAEFNLSTDSLANVTTPGRDSAFNLVVNDSSDEWQMAVYEPRETDAYDANVTVDSPAGGTDTYSVSGDFVRINVTEGTVEGSAFPALGSYSSLASNTTRFENANESRGTYAVALGLNGSGHVAAGNYNATASPVADVDIDSLEVTYRHETTRLRYETTFTIRAGGGND